MAKYTVLMTFEAPGLTAALDRRSTLRRGVASSIRLLASDGLLAVNAAGVRAETPSDAAVQIATEVGRRWDKSQGPLKVASWRADRERVRVGPRRRQTGYGQGPWPEGFLSSGSGDWPDEGDSGDGSAGVREPRRPKPGPGSMSMQADT